MRKRVNVDFLWRGVTVIKYFSRNYDYALERMRHE